MRTAVVGRHRPAFLPQPASKTAGPGKGKPFRLVLACYPVAGRGGREGGAMIGQAISLVGAAMILAAFAAQQAGQLKPAGAAYLALNFVGSAILAYFAIEARSLGLIVLEGAGR